MESLSFDIPINNLLLHCLCLELKLIITLILYYTITIDQPLCSIICIIC